MASNLPVFIILHGDGGTGVGIQGYSGFDAVADSKNFLAVYPNAVNGDWNRYADAAAGDACTGSNNPSNDVLFISDLIDHLCAAYHININKVYAVGHSAGGYMAYNLAVQLTHKIAAFAPVAGSLCGDNTFLNTALAANAPVAIYHLHGDADATVDYPDPNFTAVGYEEWPLWIFSEDDCSNTTYTSTSTIVTGVQKHVFCTAPKEISLVQVVAGGHGWPSVAGYNAADAIAVFCMGYTLSTGSTCVLTSVNELNNSTTVQVLPNPCNGLFSITSETAILKVEIMNMLGEQIYTSAFKEASLPSRAEINIAGQPKGIYIYRIKSASKDDRTGRIVID